MGRRFTQPSAAGPLADATYLGNSGPYCINNGKIATTLVGAPIEITVYNMGDKYMHRGKPTPATCLHWPKVQ